MLCLSKSVWSLCLALFAIFLTVRSWPEVHIFVSWSDINYLSSKTKQVITAHHKRTAILSYYWLLFDYYQIIKGVVCLFKGCFGLFEYLIYSVSHISFKLLEPPLWLLSNFPNYQRSRGSLAPCATEVKQIWSKWEMISAKGYLASPTSSFCAATCLSW